MVQQPMTSIQIIINKSLEEILRIVTNKSWKPNIHLTWYNYYGQYLILNITFLT